MPLLFPTQGTLSDSFAPQVPFARPHDAYVAPRRTKYQARSELYPAYSAVDDAKIKASQVGNEAVKEFDKASQKAQATAGKIEPHSPKYYAACTFGGLMACVRRALRAELMGEAYEKIGPYAHGCHPSRFSEVSPPGRFEDVQGQFRSMG